MKKLETLLQTDIGKFDQKNRLNRSAKTIPSDIIEQIESGTFTSEMIEDLRSEYPIYRYKTCITIHGDWGKISQDRVGGYKNIHQNDNGSIEIRYSAIDVQKLRGIEEALYAVDCKIHYLEDSQNRCFRVGKNITSDTLESTFAEFKEIAERVQKINFYGDVKIYLTEVWGVRIMYLQINILAIPAMSLLDMILGLTGYTIEEFMKVKDKKDKIKKEQDMKWEMERKIEQAKEMEAAKPFMEKIADFKTGRIQDGIICKLGNSGDYNYRFVFYRIFGKGSFGRVQVQKAICKEWPENLNKIVWDNHKQMKLDEVKIEGKLVQDDKVVPKRKDVDFISVSDTEMAVIGNTYQFRGNLYNAGARFSKEIKYMGRNVSGWQFNKSILSNIKNIVQ